MLSDIGLPGFILLAVLALLLFGPNKLPGLGRSAGHMLREFKNEMSDIMGDSPRQKRSSAQEPVTEQGQQPQAVRTESAASPRLPE
jgi:sec-independent protein translocase protein TatA